MRVRFLQKVAVAGGPQYNPGDVAETDRHLLTEMKAQQYVARGWAVPVPEPQKSLDRPPADKMAKGSVRK